MTYLEIYEAADVAEHEAKIALERAQEDRFYNPCVDTCRAYWAAQENYTATISDCWAAYDEMEANGEDASPANHAGPEFYDAQLDLCFAPEVTVVHQKIESEMTFKDYLSGQRINYIGLDGVEYVTYCKTAKLGLEIQGVVVVCADGQPIIIRGAKYPAGYMIGHGRGVALNMFNEAIENQVRVAA